nr:C-GCAxxG-C-C family protein [uncultured Merdimonas sp.]
MKATKKDAVKRFEKMYNCCQAVICAYCEELGMKEEDAFRLAEGFGSGMGGLKDTCGAVTGMFMTIGLKNSAGKMDDPFATKMDTYQKLLDAAEKFKEKNGSIYCRDLKTQEGPQPLPCCMKCVEDAAQIIDEMEF